MYLLKYIKMVIVHSYVSLPEGISNCFWWHTRPCLRHFSMQLRNLQNAHMRIGKHRQNQQRISDPEMMCDQLGHHSKNTSSHFDTWFSHQNSRHVLPTKRGTASSSLHAGQIVRRLRGLKSILILLGCVGKCAPLTICVLFIADHYPMSMRENQSLQKQQPFMFIYSLCIVWLSSMFINELVYQWQWMLDQPSHL